MLGQPVSMLIPLVVGVKLTGRLREGATATDLVLTITEMLRKHGVVGKFVEYFGPGTAGSAARRSRDHREHVARVRRDLRNLSRRQGKLALSAPHGAQRGTDCPGRGLRREQGLFHDEKTPEAEYSELLSSISRPSSRVLPDRSVRRIACRSEAAVVRRSCLRCEGAALASGLPAASAGSRKAEARRGGVERARACPRVKTRCSTAAS